MKSYAELRLSRLMEKCKEYSPEGRQRYLQSQIALKKGRLVRLQGLCKELQEEIAIMQGWLREAEEIVAQRKAFERDSLQRSPECSSNFSTFFLFFTTGLHFFGKVT